MDEIDAVQRLAKFPNLIGCRISEESDDRSDHSSHTWELDGPNVSKDHWIASWAMLLQRYTGIEQPVFLLEDHAVCVTAPQSVHRQIQGVEIIDDYSCTTLLSFSPLSAEVGQHALVLKVNLETNACQFRSSERIPGGFLREIAVQFMEILESIGGSESILAALKPQLSILNADPDTISGPMFLHRMLDGSHEKQNVAIEYHPSSGRSLHLSYGELYEQAERLRLQILQGYVKASTSIEKYPIVPLLITQHPDLYISQLAILKSGGAFCPINLDAPIDRVRFILQDVEAKVLLTTSALRPRLADLEETVEIICVDQLPDSRHDSPKPESISLDPESPAYVMYTSGSTGLPKGVPISHRAATQALLAHNVHIPKFKRFLQFASPTFDVSVFEIFFPLFRGSTLICSDRERLLSDLPKAINELDIDAVELTPTVAGTLVQSRRNVPNLKVMLTIGEMLTERVINEFGSVPGKEDGILVAMYGPTEVSVFIS